MVVVGCGRAAGGVAGVGRAAVGAASAAPSAAARRGGGERSGAALWASPRLAPPSRARAPSPATRASCPSTPRHRPCSFCLLRLEWRFASYRAALESYTYFLILSGKDVVRAPRSTVNDEDSGRLLRNRSCDDGYVDRLPVRVGRTSPQVTGGDERSLRRQQRVRLRCYRRETSRLWITW